MPQRKTSKRKQRITRNRSRIGRPLAIIPNETTCCLTYADSRTLDPSTYSPAQWVLKANGLYDPNTTGTGHQPLGFDQLASWYTRYTVLRSEIVVTFLPVTTADTVPLVCTVYPAISSTSADVDTLMEQPNAKSIYLRNSALYQAPKSILHTFEMKRDLGITYPRDNNANVAYFTADPGVLWNYHITVATADQASDATSLLVRVMIQYTVLAYQRKEIASS